MESERYKEAQTCTWMVEDGVVEVLSKTSKGIHDKEPPYAERHIRWFERLENESRKKTTLFSSYLMASKLIGPAYVLCTICLGKQLAW